MANNLAVLNTVYNHYMTTYASKSSSPFDTHKKSELRTVYNSIVKMNKEAPLALLKHTPKDSGEFAVNLKENARKLRNTIASLGGIDTNELLGKKSAFSSNENMVSAKYIGTIASDEQLSSFDIEVSSLATPQVTSGNYLPASSVDLPPDNYSFDISINNLNYEFQFAILSEDSNQDVQKRLARLVTNANIGITAEVVESDNEMTALKLQSLATGVPEKDTFIFTVSDDNTSKAKGAVSYLGLSDMIRPPINASFLINGNSRTSSSNTFTVERLYELTLNGIHSQEGDSATVGLKTDLESLTENISSLVDGYNSFLYSIQMQGDSFPRSNRLSEEILSIVNLYKNEFDSFGLSVQEDGIINTDSSLLQKTLEDDEASILLDTLKNFSQELIEKTNQISINPMEYVDKTIVAYKNPTRLFVNPYITSAYSGMMFNSYC